ncbi:MAG TPA: radical SAM protein [Dehalococcoidales bacterium]|nr:radical SAM protein [Dehalococcoidales bacterium]
MKGSDTVVRKKAEMQSRGVRIPPELVGELETKYNATAVRTGRMVLCLESTAGDGGLIPAFIVNGKRADTSPLHLVKNGPGHYEVWMDDEKYTDVTLLPRPGFYDDVTAGGIPRYKLAVIVGPGHLRSVVTQGCHYYRLGKACRFCAVQHWWDANIEKTPSDIADTVAAGAREGLVQHVSLTTATLDTGGKGLEGLVETAGLISARVKVPMMIEFEPLGDDSLLDSLLREGKRAGVTTVSCNIECFDEGLRPEVMPAKGRIPVAAYIETWEKCREIFGANEVFTVAVVGIGEADESILKGVEMAAAQGVMTFLVPHSPAIGAAYEDMAAPGADQMLSLYARAVAIYEKYGLNLCASRAGCVRGGGFSAIKDVARFGC